MSTSRPAIPDSSGGGGSRSGVLRRLGRGLRRTLRGKIVAIVLGVLAFSGAIALRIANPAFIQEFRLDVFDLYQQLDPRPYEPSPVRVLDLDNESITRLGQWPWPRPLVAQMVAQLANLGAAAIVFDIVFAEPDRTSPQNMVDDLRIVGASEELLQQFQELPDFDEILANVIAQTNTVTGFALSGNAPEVDPGVKAGFAYGGSDPAQFIENYPGAVPTLPILTEAATGNGSFSITPDVDGVIRRIPLVQTMGGQLYPTLSVEALRVAQGASTIQVRAADASGEVSFGQASGLTTVRIGAFDVPTTRDGKMWIHFTEAAPERMVPAWQVMQEEVPPEIADRIAGHIVMIGTSAEGLRDIRQTPLEQFEAGVNIHAMALEQMILGKFLERPDWADGAELMALLVAGLIMIFVLPYVGAFWAAMIGGLFVVAGIAGSWFAFTEARLLFDPVYPSITALAIYLVMTVTLFLQTERERAEVRQAFGRYVSPDMVAQLADDPDRLTLGGEMREITILFADIRGFTPISESMGPQDLTRFLNAFLSPMTQLIMDRRGTIDKYMGDAIMAFWNAPLDDEQHARNACLAALDMRRRLRDLNATWQADGLPPIDIGIGLNSGQAVVGNFGSDQRFDYSVLGDAVNLASRLEGQGKTYAVDNVIGEATHAAVADFAALELDLIRVKGKQIPVRIFTILGDESVASAEGYRALSAAHNRMLEAYRAQDWQGAKAALMEARAAMGAFPLAGLYDLYESRLAEFQAAPPPADWDGVYVATSK